ncbi:MAG: DUF1349 domain-containing protein [Planctomycetota bacterium]|jgi:hypothetical protein
MCRKLFYFVSFVLVLGLVGNASAQLPAGWSQQWIGDESPPGSASYDSATDTFTITGHGHDIWDAADDFHYVYQTLEGNGEITARVVTLAGTSSHTWSKAGVMIRETLDGPSTHLFAALTGGDGGGIAFQGRQATGGGSTSFHGDITASPPHWVRLKREGNTFTAYHSTDGANWELFTDTSPDGSHANPIDLDMAPSAYIGLAVTSHESGVTRTATFDNVYIGVNKKAWGPSPAHEELKTDFMMGILGTTLTWGAGATAATHDVYFGTDFDEVTAGTGDTFQGNQTDTYLLVGYGYTPEDPLPDGLEPGTTYYWRIDEVEADTVTKHTGAVWNFSLPPVTAYDPKPADGTVDVAGPLLSVQ